MLSPAILSSVSVDRLVWVWVSVSRSSRAGCEEHTCAASHSEAKCFCCAVRSDRRVKGFRRTPRLCEHMVLSDRFIFVSLEGV